MVLRDGRLLYRRERPGPLLVSSEPPPLLPHAQAESDAWSAKLMAHREHHEQEVVALRRQLKEEGADQVGGCREKIAAGQGGESQRSRTAPGTFG